MREQTDRQKREEARNNLMNWCPLVRLKPSSRHISTRNGSCSILYPSPTTAIIYWLEGSRSKSSHWTTTYTQFGIGLASVPATWDSRRRTTNNIQSGHAQRMQLPVTTPGHRPQAWRIHFTVGSPGDLRATAAFIRETGLDIKTGTNDDDEEEDAVWCPQ